jgi:hypothetical protein
VCILFTIFSYRAIKEVIMDDDRRKKRNFEPSFKYAQPDGRGRSLIITREGAFVHEDGERHTLVDAVDYFWSAVGHDPASWTETMIGYRYLLENAHEADQEDLRRTLNWLESAIPVRARAAIVAAAKYVAAMPSALLATSTPRILNILNSRILGIVWHITPDFDVKPLPPKVPKFGDEAGYGLIRSVPELYLKVMDLSSDMEHLVAGLAKEAMQYGISLPEELEAKAKS